MHVECTDIFSPNPRGAVDFVKAVFEGHAVVSIDPNYESEKMVVFALSFTYPDGKLGMYVYKVSQGIELSSKFGRISVTCADKAEFDKQCTRLVKGFGCTEEEGEVNEEREYKVFKGFSGVNFHVSWRKKPFIF